jgi:hypothetical protein
LLLLAAAPAHAAVPAPATAVRQAAAGPYCPDHPGVPPLGGFLFTRVVPSPDGDKHVDVYRVPDRFGIRIVPVHCD